MRFRFFACCSLALGGLMLIAVGGYFAFLRPPLLPEDTRYIGTSLAQIQSAAPGLSSWLARVFSVLGAFMFGMGMLTVYVAATQSRVGSRGTLEIVTFAGLASIGWMVVTNFIINSDFKWLLLTLMLPWVMAVAMLAAARCSKA